MQFIGEKSGLALWEAILKRYDRYIRNKELEIEMENLDSSALKTYDEKDWHQFLTKYFKWKFSGNYLARRLNKLEEEWTGGKLNDTLKIRDELFSFDTSDPSKGLEIAGKIKGLRVSGASGLLALSFPGKFGTVDKFVLRSLKESACHEANFSSNETDIRHEDGVRMIEIMRKKAKELNSHSSHRYWTPRKIDKVLWTLGH